VAKLFNSTPDDYKQLTGLSFQDLFPGPIRKADHALLSELKDMAAGRIQSATPKAIKCFKGLQQSDLVSALFTIGEKNVAYSTQTELHEIGLIDLKCRIDLVDKDTAAFLVLTTAVDAEGFIRACIKNNHWTRAAFTMLASDTSQCFVIGVSTAKPGRMFVSGFKHGTQRYIDAHKLIRSQIAKRYIQDIVQG